MISQESLVLWAVARRRPVSIPHRTPRLCPLLVASCAATYTRPAPETLGRPATRPKQCILL